jgi:hypothetical protein
VMSNNPDMRVTRHTSPRESGARLSPRCRAVVYLLRFDAGIDHSVLS